MPDRIEVPLPEPRRIHPEAVGRNGYVAGLGFTADQLRAYAQQCVEAERERAAKVVETFPHWLGNQGRTELATAIRKKD